MIEPYNQTESSSSSQKNQRPDLNSSRSISHSPSPYDNISESPEQKTKDSTKQDFYPMKKDDIDSLDLNSRDEKNQKQIQPQQQNSFSSISQSMAKFEITQVFQTINSETQNVKENLLQLVKECQDNQLVPEKIGKIFKNFESIEKATFELSDYYHTIDQEIFNARAKMINMEMDQNNYINLFDYVLKEAPNKLGKQLKSMMKKLDLIGKDPRIYFQDFSNENQKSSGHTSANQKFAHPSEMDEGIISQKYTRNSSFSNDKNNTTTPSSRADSYPNCQESEAVSISKQEHKQIQKLQSCFSEAKKQFVLSRDKIKLELIRLQIGRQDKCKEYLSSQYSNEALYDYIQKYIPNKPAILSFINNYRSRLLIGYLNICMVFYPNTIPERLQQFNTYDQDLITFLTTRGINDIKSRKPQSIELFIRNIQKMALSNRGKVNFLNFRPQSI